MYIQEFIEKYTKPEVDKIDKKDVMAAFLEKTIV